MREKKQPDTESSAQEYTPNFRGVPEKFKEEGAKVHYNELAKIGDEVEAIADVQNGIVPKGTIAKINDILIEPQGNVRGFSRSIKIEGFEGEFNPKRFRKVRRPKETLEYFGIQGEMNKDSTQILLNYAHNLFNSSSVDLLSKVSFNMGGKKYSLLYTIDPRKSGSVWVRVGLYEGDPPKEIKDTTDFNPGEISMTQVKFSFDAGVVVGQIGTRENYEGRGFGTAMLFMREGVIKDIMRRYEGRVSSEQGLHSQIEDNSRSQRDDKNYDGLTSALASRMGYQPSPLGNHKFYKLYGRK